MGQEFLKYYGYTSDLHYVRYFCFQMEMEKQHQKELSAIREKEGKEQSKKVIQELQEKHKQVWILSTLNKVKQNQYVHVDCPSVLPYL